MIADTDNDGIFDFAEYTCLDSGLDDSDHDGLSDGFELSMGLNPCNSDTDNDGIPDGYEVQQIGSNPNKQDTYQLIADGGTAWEHYVRLNQETQEKKNVEIQSSPRMLNLVNIDEFLQLHPQLGNNQSFTLSLWIKFDRVTGRVQRLGAHDGINHRAYLGLTERSHIYAGVGDSYINTTAANIEPKQWASMTLVYDADSSLGGQCRKVCIDGPIAKPVRGY